VTVILSTRQVQPQSALGLLSPSSALCCSLSCLRSSSCSKARSSKAHVSLRVYFSVHDAGYTWLFRLSVVWCAVVAGGIMFVIFTH
jgi:hypothetical protein